MRPGRVLRILQVIPTLGKGGAERLVVELSRYLKLQGHHVKILVFRDENLYEELTDELGITVIPAMVSYSFLGKDTIEIEAFNSFVEEFKPDIIHSHLVEAELVSRNTIFPKVQYFNHWHGCHPMTDPPRKRDFFSKNAWWNWWQLKHLYQQYQKSNTTFICISNFINVYLKSAIRLNENRFHTIYNGGNPFFGELPTQKNNQIIKLVSLGRLAPFKNQMFLLEVMKLLISREILEIHLSFLGDGPSFEMLKNYVAQNRLENWVTFHGHVRKPDQILVTADMLVHSTLNEAFGMAIVEAMSCGLPVIAFRSGGIPEIVENNVNGFLVEENDLIAFTDKVEYLVRNMPLRKQFSKSAPQRAQAFTMEAFVKNVDTLYRQKLSE